MSKENNTHVLLCGACPVVEDWRQHNAGDKCPNCGEALLVLFNLLPIPRNMRSKLVSFAYNGGTQWRYNFEIDNIDTGSHIVVDKSGKIWHADLISVPIEEFPALLCQVMEHLSTATPPIEEAPE